MTIPGLETTNLPDGLFICVNASELPCYLAGEANCAILHIIPQPSTGIQSLIFYGENASSFWKNGNLIEGYFKEVGIESKTFNIPKGGCFSTTAYSFNFSFETPFVPTVPISSTVYEGSTPEDFANFSVIAIIHNFEYVKAVSYTAVFQGNGVVTGPANLTFGVSSDWLRANGWGDHGYFSVDTDPEGVYVYVDGVLKGRSPLNITGMSPGLHIVNVSYNGRYPNSSVVFLKDERDSVGVMRIGDDGQGDLLPAEFLYHDPGTGMDYFKVSSPKGLSRFSLVTLGKSGNIFQLVYLTLQNAVSGGTAGGGGGGGYGGSGSGVASQEANPVANPTSIQDTGIMPKETKLAVSVDEVPPTAAAQISSPAAADTPADSGDAMQAGEAPVVNPLPFTMALLKNLSIVFLVFFITIVLYVRWKRSGGGEGNE